MNVPKLTATVPTARPTGPAAHQSRRVPIDLDSLNADESLPFDDVSWRFDREMQSVEDDGKEADKAPPSSAGLSQNGILSPAGQTVVSAVAQATLPRDGAGGSTPEQGQVEMQNAVTVVAGLSSPEDRWSQEDTQANGLATRLRALVQSTAPRLFRVNLGVEQLASEAAAGEFGTQIPAALKGVGPQETGTAGSVSVASASVGSASPLGLSSWAASGAAQSQGSSKEAMESSAAPGAGPSGAAPKGQPTNPIVTAPRLGESVATDGPEPESMSSSTVQRLQVQDKPTDSTSDIVAGSASQGVITEVEARARSIAVRTGVSPAALDGSANSNVLAAQSLPPGGAGETLPTSVRSFGDLVAGHTPSADLRLDSPALGAVDLRLTSSADGMAVPVSFGSPAVASVVQADLTALHALLEQAGLGDVSLQLTGNPVESIGVSPMSDRGDERRGGDQRGGTDGSVGNESAAHPTASKPDVAMAAPTGAQPVQSQLSVDAPAVSAGLGEQSLSMRQQSEILDQVVRASAMLSASHQESARIDLSPPSLGRLELQMVVEDGKALVHIVAEKPETRDVLATNLSQLRSALMDQGLVADQLSVSMGFGSNGSPWQSPTTSHTPWRQERLVQTDREVEPVAAVAAESEQERSRWGVGLVDLYA